MVAGLVANTAAQASGYVAPFVVAILPLSIAAGLVSMTWTENYGNQQQNIMGSLSAGFDLIRHDSRIAALGMGQSCFEGAMYTFVFMWTPALKTEEESAAEKDGLTLEDSTSKYLGLIFAVFMVCVMVGSSIFKLVATQRKNLYKVPLYLHAVAFVSMGLTAVFFETKMVVYVMFLVFETTVGVFYPAYGVIKSEKIPEEIRSSVMNIFRYVFRSRTFHLLVFFYYYTIYL